MATAWKTDPGCRGCYYLGSTGMGKTCDFLLMAGRRRRPSTENGCPEYLPKKRNNVNRPFSVAAPVKPNMGSKAQIVKPKECGIAPKKRNRPPTKLDEERAMELYRLGLSDREIGARLGLSHCGVQNWRKRNGLQVIAPQKRIDDHNEQVMALYKQGLTDSAIGESVGFSATVVRKWRLRHGLPATHQSGWPKK